MLTLILSLLGLGGIGGAFAIFGPATILAFVKGLPWQVWAGVAVVALLTLGYCHAEKAGETKGATKATAEVRKHHDEVVAVAHTDTVAAQATADRIGDRTAKMDQQTTDYLRNQLEELHHEIDAAKAAPAGAGPPVIDTASLSARLDEGIARANGAAASADAQP